VTKLLILDLKGDTPWVLRYPHVLPFDALDFAPLACPEYSTPREFLPRVRALYEEIFWGAALQSGVITPVFEELIGTNRIASLAEAQRRIAERDKSPAGKGAVQRLDAIRVAYPTIFASEKNLWTQLHEASIYFRVDGPLSPAARFLFWHLVSERFAYLRATGQRDRVHTVIALDEASATFSRRQQTVSGLASTPVQLLPTTREHGIQFVVATPSWNELDPLILSQFQVQVALQPSDGRELDAIAKSFRLTPAQVRYAAAMQRGTAIGKIRGIEQPFVFTYAPFTQRKDIDPQTLTAARARAEEFCRMAAREEDPRQQPTAAPSASPPSRVAPVVVPPKKDEKKQESLALNTVTREILTYVAERGIATPGEIAQARRFHPQQIARGRRTAVAFGFIEAHELVLRSGRGGKGVGLTLTAKAYGQLGLTRAHLGKGGPQHQYVLRELRDHLGATLEVQGADAVVTYDAMKHQFLQEFLGIALNAGDTIAIEAEISRPASTAEKNIARNAAFTRTVVATLPTHVAALRATYAGNDQVIVVDVLRLLDAIRRNA